MQQSYEALDRPGGFSRVRLFAPLSHRDYRLLAGGMSVSLLGDGLFLVALAWQVYTMSDAPTALATVGIAMTIPTITCLLIGGAVSDRFDRRLVMLTADTVRARGLGLARGARRSRARSRSGNCWRSPWCTAPPPRSSTPPRMRSCRSSCPRTCWRRPTRSTS